MRGLKSDLVLLDEAKDFTPYGESPLLKVVKVMLYFKLLEEANMAIYRGEPLRDTKD